MGKYTRFIVRTDHGKTLRCTGVVTMLRILGEEGKLPQYHVDYSKEIFDILNEEMTCPPFDEKNYDKDSVCWFKDTEEAQKWIKVFRDIVAILEDSDIEVATLRTSKPGMILYEDEIQVVAKSKLY